MRLRPTLLAPLALLTLAGLAGCGRADRPAPRDTARAAAGRPVTVGYLAFVASLPYFAAEREGFFRQAGVQTQGEALASSNLLVGALAAGTVDFVPAASAAPVLALEARAPGRVKLVSASVVDAAHPYDAILVRRDAPLRTLADLRGRRIGVFPGTTAAVLLKKYLADQRLDTATITLVPLPPANQVGALVQGAVDAIHSYEPTTTMALLRPDVRRLFGSVYAAQLSPNPQGIAAISTRFLERDPDAARRLVHGYDRALRWVQAHPDSARLVLRTVVKLDSTVAARTAIPWMVPSAEIDTVALQRYADLLYEVGELPRRVRAAALVWRP